MADDLRRCYGAPGSEPSLSSSDADHIRRQQRRRQRTRHAVAAPAAGVPPAPLLSGALGTVAAAADVPPAVGFRMAPLSQLSDDFPTLQNPSLDAPSTGSFREDPNHNPFAVEACRRALERLPRPRYAIFPLADHLGQGDMDQAMAERALFSHQRGLALPLLTADYEARLLGEAGSFPWINPETGQRFDVTYPPCRYGRDCVGNRGSAMQQELHLTDALLGLPSDHPGVTLSALVFPDEWPALVHGQPPSEARPCILCYRLLFSDYVYSWRWSSFGDRPQPGRVFQLYANPINTPGGYHAQFALQPQLPCADFLIDPIAEFRYTHLRLCQDSAQAGRWVVDQTDMVFREPLPAARPVTGQPLNPFC